MAVYDANFLIALEEADAGAQKVDLELRARHAPLRIPAMVWVEYLVGLPAKKRPVAQARLDDDTVFEPFTRELAATAIQLQVELKAKGCRMSWTDLQIAATVMRVSEPVVSNDRAFDVVPGLTRIGF